MTTFHLYKEPTSKNPLNEAVLRAARIPGLTDQGRAWLMKAMHPSDAVSGMAGIPTLDSRPTVPLNFMTTTVVSAPNAATWGANIFLNPSPLYFGKVMTASSTPSYGSQTIYNTQLGVSGFGEFGATARNWNNTALDTWFRNVCKYRLCYASVTATLSASAVANEGTVTCAQYPLMARFGYNPSFNIGLASCFSIPKNAIYPIQSRQPSVLQGLIGSTTWEAREGAYSILRLSEDAMNWNTSSELQLPLGFPGTYATQSGSIDVTAVTDLSASGAASVYDSPFAPQGLWGRLAISGTGATFAVSPTGAQTLPPSQDYQAQLCFSGLDPTATITLTYRVGFEAIVPPESIYAGQVTPALYPDPLALQTYFSHSAQLQSAYPASYNIFGALLTGLKTVGGALMPHVISAGRNLLGSVSSQYGTAPLGPTTGAHTVTSQYDMRPPPTVEYIPERRPTRARNTARAPRKLKNRVRVPRR